MGNPNVHDASFGDFHVLFAGNVRGQRLCTRLCRGAHMLCYIAYSVRSWLRAAQQAQNFQLPTTNAGATGPYLSSPGVKGFCQRQRASSLEPWRPHVSPQPAAW